jgi:ATF/CREB family transcription factor
VKADNKPNPVEPPKLPALPPRPPSTSKSPSLSLEPNPFEQSFGGAPSGPTTPGGTKLPPVAALTSPSSLLPGGTPFWGGSLRTGPLSPAMLSGPTDYFSDTHHIRSFPTPNESSIRTTGLTPGGSGSMFPPAAPSPGSLFSLGGPAPTPEQAQAAQQQQPPTSVPPPPQSSLGSGDGLSKNVDPHDNDAANGLFMLAQGRPSVQPPPPSNYPAGPLVDGLAPSSTAPQAQTLPAPSQLNGTSSLPGPNEANAAAAEPETARPSTRGKKRSISGATGGSRRKAEETPKEPPNKKGRANGGAATSSASSDDRHSADEQQQNGGGKEQTNTGSSSKSKMTDEEKRKNFLERNRCVVGNLMLS